MRKHLLLLISINSLCLLEACGGANANNGGDRSPLTATHFTVAAQATASVGTPFNFTVTALDASNNVAATYAGTVRVTSSDTQAVLVPASSRLTNGKGTFSATMKSIGGQTITATDTASITGTSNSINVSAAAAATHFSVATPASAASGTFFVFPVSALDDSNNVVTSYSGVVHFTSTDSQALLPSDSGLENGVGTFVATLATLGTQEITAIDTATSITGTSSSIDILAAGSLVIISGQPPNGRVGTQYGGLTEICGNFTLEGFELEAVGGSGHGGPRGSPSYTWNSSPLPPGLSLDQRSFGNGLPGCPKVTLWFIDGVPAASGTFTFSVTASTTFDAATASYTITIEKQPTQASRKVSALSASVGKHHHYKLIDVGTFGGPFSQYSVPSSVGLNNRGTATGVADTSTPDPNCFFDCFVDHAFVSRDGVTTDLGTLPGGPSSFAYTVNKHGLIVGQSQIGSIDPLTGLQELRGVLWRNGQIIDLGTLGGNASNANAINDRGQVVGGATNLTIDPFANVPQSACHVLTTGLLPSCSVFTFATNSLFSPSTTETRAFLWHDGVMRDLGTLGGPDSNALINNDRGEVAGWSYTSFVANPSTGTPTVDPFVWSPGDSKMTDLGSLGGTFGAPFFMNNRGQVIGVSNLAGDLIVHPYLWSKSKGMKDLGTLGGTYGHPNWINDKGEVIGFSDLEGDQAGHAFLWRHGVMTDLGTIGTDPSSEAGSINSQGQIVGGTFIFGGADLHGWLWENGGPIVDLEMLTVPGSGLTVIAGNLINDHGEIAGRGILPNGDTHAILLIPCDENHVDVDGCDYSLVDTTAATQSPAPYYIHTETQRTPPSRWINRYHIPGPVSRVDSSAK